MFAKCQLFILNIFEIFRLFSKKIKKCRKNFVLSLRSAIITHITPFQIRILCYNGYMREKKLNILIASDSFKGSLSSSEIAEIFAVEGKNFNVAVKGVTVADGGEGTLDAILSSGKYVEKTAECHNPLFEKITARYAVSGDVAIIEMAECSGLTLIPYCLGNARITTTYGTGELIRKAIVDGAKHVYVCVGGSATNDGGIGALSALGFEFSDENAEPIDPIGENLIRIRSVRKTDDVTDGVRFTVIADVDNPLLGEKGASYFYGPQKGATEEDVVLLEKGMKNYADVTETVTGVKLHDKRSAGAAGGLAGGLMAYLGAEVKSGIDSVLEIIDFPAEVAKADIVVTGEGKIDEQSLHGKAIYGVCKIASALSVPVYAIAGYSTLSEKDYRTVGIKGVETLLDDSDSVEDSILNARIHACNAAKKLLATITENEL